MHIERKYRAKYLFFAALGLLSAAGNMGVISIVNKIINDYVRKDTGPVGLYMLLFGGSLLVFFTSRWLMSVNIIKFMQDLLKHAKVSIVQMVLRSSYHPLTKSKERVFTALTRDTNNIVNAAISAVDLLTNSIVIILCCIYMGILSVKLLLCTLLLLGLALSIYVISERKARVLFKKAMSFDDQFVLYLNEMLSGFKEIIISRRKGIDILDRKMIVPLNEGMKLQRKALVFFLNNRIIGQLSFYVFIGAILLFLGRQLGIAEETMINFIFLILYVWGPIETVVLLVPGISQASISWNRLNALSEELKEKGLEIYSNETHEGFKTLYLEDVFYRYHDENMDQTFSVGPANFKIHAGETIFIYGGNGSGKTTFINLLMGLFLFDEGEVYIDNVRYTGSLSRYRSLFATLFSDFHLFDEIYGIDYIDEDKINEYLLIFELDKKVTFSGGRFSSINLSTGQRKRLGLICAMIERKPVLILDEFAADQDPHFRNKFYREILQYLKMEGFTVVAITHDDAYYKYCDRLYNMDYGKISAVDMELADFSKE